MCASYGLEPTMELPNYEPLFQPESQQFLEQWMDQRSGTAKITGRKARNLNPLITAPEGKRQLDLAWWWLHVGDEPAQFSAFNARDDKLLHSRVWKKPFAQHRGLTPAHWYIEKGQRFELPNTQGFAIATIVATSHQPDGDFSAMRWSPGMRSSKLPQCTRACRYCCRKICTTTGWTPTWTATVNCWLKHSRPRKV